MSSSRQFCLINVPLSCYLHGHKEIFILLGCYLFKVWDTLTTYKCVKTLEGHSGIVLALCTHEYVSCFSLDLSLYSWPCFRVKVTLGFLFVALFLYPG